MKASRLLGAAILCIMEADIHYSPWQDVLYAEKAKGQQTTLIRHTGKS